MKTSAETLFNELNRRLFQPSPEVTRPDERFKAQITSVALFTATIALFIRTLIAEAQWAFVLFTAIAALCYLVSRTRNYRFAAWAVVLLLCLPSYWLTFTRSGRDHPDFLIARFSWLAFALVLGSLVLSPRHMALLAGVNMLAIAALPVFLPGLATRSVVATLGFVGVLAILIIETLRLHSSIERERQKAALHLEMRINEIAQVISGTLDPEAVLDAVLRLSAELVRADSGMIMLADDAGERVQRLHTFNIPPERQADFIPPAGGVTWTTFKSGRSIRLDNYAAHPRAVDKIAEYGVRAYMAAPIIAAEKTMDVLVVFSTTPEKRFEGREIVLLSSLARQAGVAIRNAQLYAALQDELTERRLIESALSQRDAILESAAAGAGIFLRSTDMDAGIQALLDLLGEQTGSSHAYIFVNHAGPDGAPVNSQRFEWTAPGFESNLHNPVFQNVPLLAPGLERWYALMRRGEPFSADRRSLSAEEARYLTPNGAKSIIEVPINVRLLGHDSDSGDLEWWGLVGFDDYAEERRWSDAEIDALKILAGLLGSAVARRRYDRALRESEAMYHRAISGAGAVPYYKDPERGGFTFIDDAVLKLTGYSPAEMSLDLWRRLIHEAAPRGEAAGLSLAEAEEKMRRGEIVLWKCDYYIRTRSGRMRWIADTAVEVHGSDGRSRGTMGILQDISERVQAEDEIRRLNAELEIRVRERTAELEAANRELESFAHSVSHDLRAPLRALDGYSRILLDDYAARLDDEGRAMIDNLRLAAQNMTRLIDDLLKLSRLTRGELKSARVDLSAIAAETLAEAAAQSPQRRVEVHVQPGLLTTGDANLLRVALENLLGNAWKFTRGTPAARIEMGVTERDGRQVFFVRDNGAGFDMNYVEQLFQPFKRLHSTEVFEGTGLGLATVARIIRRHNGEVWAEGEVDRGAVFYFTLPEPPSPG